MSSSLPPRVPRLDPTRLIAALAARHGLELRLLGTATTGEVGAAFVRLPDGREGVLGTLGDDSPETGARIRRAAEALALARSRGVPVPRYELIRPVAGVHVVIQDRLPGRPPGRADAALIERMITATEAWSGLLTGRPGEPPSLHLDHSGPGFCLHESLRHYDRRTQRLLDRVREIGRTGPTVITGDDLTHLDYHPGNVLVDDRGLITGIVDWDFAGRGDRWFSLEVLSYGLAAGSADRAAQQLLRERIEAAVPADRLRAYRAHLALRQVDWVIRHNGPADVDRWLAVATDRLGAD